MGSKKKEVRTRFRNSVFNRDDNKCVICGSERDLDAHHITNRNLMPKGGYVAENGVTLCGNCHIKAELADPKDHMYGTEALYTKIGSSKEKAMEAT